PLRTAWLSLTSTRITWPAICGDRCTICVSMKASSVSSYWRAISHQITPPITTSAISAMPPYLIQGLASSEGFFFSSPSLSSLPSPFSERCAQRSSASRGCSAAADLPSPSLPDSSLSSPLPPPPV